ncbi:hypothetical protein HDU93_004112, partial [Gonapodya sp. JEL0774]
MAPFLSTLATIPFGLAAGRQMTGALGYFRKSLPADDPSKNVTAVLTGFGPADAFLKVIVPFFRNAIADRAAGGWLQLLSQVMTPWLFYASIEGLKPDGRVAHFLYPSMAVFMQ